jgi:hypothetical protein
MCEPSNTITAAEPSPTRNVLERVGNHTCIVMAQLGGSDRSSPRPPGASEALATRWSAGAEAVPLSDPPQAEARTSAAARATLSRRGLIGLG